MKTDNFPIVSFNYQEGNLQKKSVEIGFTFYRKVFFLVPQQSAYTIGTSISTLLGFPPTLCCKKKGD